MDISHYIELFVKQKHAYKSYAAIYKNVLLGGKPYSLNMQTGYQESEYLPYSIKDSVRAYSSNKDIMIALYKDFVSYLEHKGVQVPEIKFPPVPVSNTFERLMFIAKYLQEEENRISDLPDILWVSGRTIEEDISRLRGVEDPIQVCGRKFFIPDTKRENGSMRFSSTAHPLFLAENLTQILVMLKGLKAMSENPFYEPYAVQTGKEIWDQLSTYAKKRIRFVLSELMPEDFSWYEELESAGSDNHFHSESACSQVGNTGTHLILDCLKNGKSFCMEYMEEDGVHLYKDCVIDPHSFSSNPLSVVVSCSAGRKQILADHVIRSAYTAEELASN